MRLVRPAYSRLSWPTVFGGCLVLGLLATLLAIPSPVLAWQGVPDGRVVGGEPVQTSVPKPVSHKSPMDLLRGLGTFIYPMGLASIIVIWFSIERLAALRRGRVIPKPFVKRFFDHMEQGNLDYKTALQLCEENGSPVAQVFAHGLRKWGKPSVEVEQAIIDGGERQTSQLRKHIRVLNGAATVAPLLGLLGTVIGMIEAFNNIGSKHSMGKTEDLAAGIGLALLTTAGGLIIAIPALVMYMYLAGRVDALVMEMDRLSQRLIDLISAEGLADQAQAGRIPARNATVGETRKTG